MYTLQYEPGFKPLKNTEPSPISLVRPLKVYFGVNFWLNWFKPFIICLLLGESYLWVAFNELTLSPFGFLFTKSIEISGVFLYSTIITA